MTDQMMAAGETDFDDWLRDAYGQTQGFTMLIVLIGLAAGRVNLLRSAHLHVIGDELTWAELAGHFDGAGVDWDAVVLFMADKDGVIADDLARERLDALMRAMNGDRTLIREGGFFNRDGLSLRLDDDDASDAQKMTAPPRLN